ncbi:MAG: ATP-dependent helicase Lhr and Lhr-like helicase [Acidimicrobiaceae bacterium]|nr:ATP-dependent helicase Lhr and Lhr-like helicase [Acidimicrobiaceae bacterium]
MPAGVAGPVRGRTLLLQGLRTLAPVRVLDLFSEVTKAWFCATFASPTPAQVLGWEAISRGDHTLVLAPTGSGKTLAAFLWALDRLLTHPPPADERARCRVLYVSPLKALTYDVERNLRAPLTGIAMEADRAGTPAPTIRVATRTGDTPEGERRQIQRHPPDILITTPESLYLMLTSSARDVLASVEHVIVDEIHAVAGTKRGAHMALSLERLERVVAEAGRPPPQRIGLSATQRPLDELARFLGGRTSAGFRPVSVVDAGVRKELDLQVVVPVEDMAELGKRAASNDELVMSGPAAGDPEVRTSIWPSIHPVLLDLIRQHRSTLIFVNSRRLAERLAARLNELAAEQGEKEDLVRAHHGSIAREQRLEIEDALKAGKLPALVATSSLELGIDMGAIDLVVQVEAPSSVASGLQRIGRAGHSVGEPSKGRIFPKFRGDLVVAAVAAQRMQAGLIEETSVPRNPLDVLAQQIVAMVAMEPLSVDEVFDLVTRAYNFAELSREQLEGVLDMLSGRYPSDEFAELRPRVVWDRVGGVLSERKGARMLAVTSGGTIPDRGLFGVFTPEGSRVGELDEEFVYESRTGETMLLGATTWRIEDITKDRVVVTPAPGQPGKMPFWHGDQVGRPFELGRAIGAFLRELDGISDERLATEHGLDALAIRNLRGYVDEEKAATGGVVPTDRQLVIERFRDELGDWRLCVLSPFGARVHAPWALAIEARVRDRLGLEAQAIWSDDGIVVRLPEADESPPSEFMLLDPDEIDDLVVEQVASSALFASRFRENAARALLLPRRRPGSRTPLWQQRQKSADLLAVASRYGSFPILLETYRECLRDVFDLPALIGLMRDVRSRKVRVVSVDTPVPSPFAASLAFSYIASFMYEGDAPLAERRAQALTLDRRMLAELVGSEELRELLDPASLAQLEAELQALDERRWARSEDAAADLLRRLGDLTRAELDARCTESFAAALVASRRAVEVRVAGEERLIAVEDAGRYRDGLGVAVPRGVPDAFLEPVPDALSQLVRRWARTHGPFVTAEPAARLGMPVELAEDTLARLAGAGTVVRGEFRPEGTEREWCDAEVLRLLRQRSLAALRREVEPISAEALARFLPAWQGVGGEGRGIDRCFEVVAQLQGVPMPASVLERDVLSSRMREYSPRLLDELLAAGEVMWVGAGSIGREDGKVVLLLRDRAHLLLPVLAQSAETPAEPEHDRIRQALAERGACFFRELAVDDRVTLDALWDLVWAGEVTNDSFAAVRALSAKKRSGGKARGGRPRLGSLAALGPPTAQGRWSLVAREVGGLEAAHTESVTALAGVLLERHGVVTRESVRGEGVPGGYAGVYPVLRAMEEGGRIRRGYFVTGLGGAQFALPGAVDRLRAFRDGEAEGQPGAVVLAATDPANPYGVALPWPAKGPQRAAGAFVVLVGGLASLYVERGGKGLVALRAYDGTWEDEAVAALGRLLAAGRFKRLTVERADPDLEPRLRAAGFVPTPKGLVRYA